MPVDYKQGKIYKIYSTEEPDLIYIGSTAQKYISTRLAQHKQQFRTFTQIVHQCEITVYSIFRKHKVETAVIELIKAYPCKSRYGLQQKEHEYIRKMKCVNISVMLSKDEKKKRITPVTCECGSVFRFSHKVFHLKTAVHKAFIEAKKQGIPRVIEQKLTYADFLDSPDWISKENARRIRITCACGGAFQLLGIRNHNTRQCHKTYVANNPDAGNPYTRSN